VPGEVAETAAEFPEEVLGVDAVLFEQVAMLIGVHFLRQLLLRAVHRVSVAVLAGLLLFRLLYYIAPFVLALAILGAREVWLNLKGTRVATPKLIKSVTAPIRSEIEAEKTDAD